MIKNPGSLPVCEGEADVLVATVLSTVNTERIICFGLRVRAIERWSCFCDHSRESCRSYDLLIITGNGERKQSHEVADTIEKRLAGAGITANVLVHPSRTVAEAVLDGNHFFSTVCQTGSLIYESAQDPVRASTHYQALGAVAHLRSTAEQSYMLGRQFLSGALHFYSLGDGGMTTFMLHQVVEHTCIGLIYLVTGYRFSTHNLRRLLAITENFSEGFSFEFPCNTREETELFLVLARAYSDVRYRSNFFVTGSVAGVLLERVQRFRTKAEALFNNRQLEMLKKCTCGEFSNPG